MMKEYGSIYTCTQDWANECELPNLAQHLSEYKTDGLGMKLVLIKVLKKRVNKNNKISFQTQISF